MTNEAGMNGGARAISAATKRLTRGAANLRACNLRPLKVGGAGRSITGVGRIFETEEGAMSSIILFATPAIAALGALVWLGLFVQALNGAKTNQARVRVPARRLHSR